MYVVTRWRVTISLRDPRFIAAQSRILVNSMRWIDGITSEEEISKERTCNNSCGWCMVVEKSSLPHYGAIWRTDEGISPMQVLTLGKMHNGYRSVVPKVSFWRIILEGKQMMLWSLSYFLGLLVTRLWFLLSSDDREILQKRSNIVSVWKIWIPNASFVIYQ